MGNHAGKVGFEFQFVHVGLGTVERHLLAVALQFQDPQGGGIGLIVRSHGLLEALHVFARNLHLLYVLQTIDLRENRTFLQFHLGLGKIGLGLLEIGRTFFKIGTVLRLLLFHLVSQVVVLGLGIT